MSQKTVRAAAHSLRNITPPSASASASRTASTLPPFNVPGQQRPEHVEKPSQPGLTSPRRAPKLSPPTLVYEGTMTIFEGPTHPGRQCQRPGVHSGKTPLPDGQNIKLAMGAGAGRLTPAANSWYVADVILQAH
ncbi:hypothetical protein B0H14DRAFT_2558781 [Mycena olivaceomarginata]|nr:hypothetical protein B0H14DRAFT_2558781 [Mycena olivaceomarginata]